MKKLILTAFFSLSLFCLNAQIVLKHTYVGGHYGASLINIGTEQKYIMNEKEKGYFNIYNLDHSLYKHVVLPFKSNINVDSLNFEIRHISNTIIDCDSSTVEYVIDYSLPIAQTRIYNEKGKLLLLVDSFNTFPLSSTFGQAELFITNTPSGAVMRLINYQGSSPVTKVYQLCGKYTGIQKVEKGNMPSDFGEYLNYPNPTYDETRIDYKLPKGVHQAELILFNEEGKEVHRYRLDDTFDNLIIDTQDLAAGIYSYSMLSNYKMEKGGRIVVVK